MNEATSVPIRKPRSNKNNDAKGQEKFDPISLRDAKSAVLD